MSYRELAEAAPCSVSTVTRAMPRLRAAGWLQVAERGRGRTVLDADATLPENRCSVEAAHATRWRLLDAHSEHTGGTPLARTELSVLTLRAPCTARARLDACRWRGLGLNAPRVLEALVGGPLSDVELAGRLNLNRGNLRSRLLPRLAMFALVSRTATGWELSADLGTAMAAAAENLGLAGKAAAVAERHQAEREQYLVHREEFAAFVFRSVSGSSRRRLRRGVPRTLRNMTRACGCSTCIFALVTQTPAKTLATPRSCSPPAPPDDRRPPH